MLSGVSETEARQLEKVSLLYEAAQPLGRRRDLIVPLLLADPAPTIAVSELADSSVNLIVRPWTNTKDFGAARGSVMRALKEGIEAGGCSFPYPQQDVHVVSSSGSL